MSIKDQNSFWKLSAVSFIITSGINLITVLPMMVGGLEEQYGFTRQSLGLFASADTLGVCMCGIAMFFLLPRYPIRKLVLLGLLGLIIFHTLSFFISNASILAGIRVLAGFSGGLAYVAALAWFAKTEHPHLGYSNYIIVYSIYSALLLIIYPTLLDIGGVKAGWSVLIILAIIAWLLAWRLEWEISEDFTRDGIEHTIPLKLTIILVLLFLAFVTFQAGNSSLYSFMERIGNEKGIDPILNGIAISSSIGTGLLAGFLVPWLGRKLFSGVQVLVGLSIMLLCNIILLMNIQGYLAFLIAVGLFGFGFNITLPNFLNLFARLDRSGRALALGTVTNWLGQSVGPLLGAFVLGHRPYLTIVYPSAIFLILSFGAIFLINVKESRQKNV